MVLISNGTFYYFLDVGKLVKPFLVFHFIPKWQQRNYNMLKLFTVLPLWRRRTIRMCQSQLSNLEENFTERHIHYVNFHFCTKIHLLFTKKVKVPHEEVNKTWALNPRLWMTEWWEESDSGVWFRMHLNFRFFEFCRRPKQNPLWNSSHTLTPN